MTRNAFHLLGLDADADERAVKRAYAAKLKTVRPDEDPEGFQRLNEAYQAALRWVQSRDAQPRPAAIQTPSDIPELAPSHRREDPAPDGGTPETADAPPAVAPPARLRVRQAEPLPEPLPPEPLPPELAPPAAPPFDPARFHYAFALAAANSSPHGFRLWLTKQPELLSLQLKARLGRSLLEFLFDQQPPMRRDNFDAFCHCFGYDDVTSGQDPVRLQALARHLHRVWQAEGGERHGVVIAIPCDAGGWPTYGGERGRARIAEDERIKREKSLTAAAWVHFPELLRPWSWLQMTLLCLVFGRERKIAELLRRYGRETWPAGTDKRVADFWRDAADRSRRSFARSFQRAVRLTVYGGTFLGLVGFSLLGDGGVPLLHAAAIMLAVFAVPLSILLIGGVAQWQTLPDSSHRFERALQYATIPIVLLMAFALGEIPPYYWSPVPAGFAAGMALPRYRRRSDAPGWASLIRKYLPWTGLQAVLIAGLLIGIGPTWKFLNDSPWGIPVLSWSLAAIAAGFWATDAVAHLREARRG